MVINYYNIITIIYNGASKNVDKYITVHITLLLRKKDVSIESAKNGWLHFLISFLHKSSPVNGI
jgi:hypothetical protein